MWSFEDSRYLLLKKDEASTLEKKVEEAKKLLGLEGFPVEFEEELEEPEGEATKVEAEAKPEAKLEPKVEAPEKALEKGTGSNP